MDAFLHRDGLKDTEYRERRAYDNAVVDNDRNIKIMSIVPQILMVA